MTLKTLSTYGKGFQLKVLKTLLTDREFLLEVSDVLDESYFDTQTHKWIVSEILKYYKKYNTTISLEVLKIELKKVDNEILQAALKEELKATFKIDIEDQTYVKEEFTSFCKNQKLKEALLESADLLTTGDFDTIRVKIENALKAGIDKNIGHEYKKDVETRYRESTRNPIPTPWPAINEITQGGFGAGDLVIAFGPPGAGKSWLMIALAGHAIQLGYNVLYYTLELSEDYIGKRVDSYVTGISIQDIKDHKKEVETIMSEVEGNLIIKEYPPKQASLFTIKSHIQKCTDQNLSPDLIIIDYADYLKTPSKRQAERKDEIDDIYIGCKGLAKELKIPVVTPSQINRLGSKDNVIEGDKAAGSYDKMMVGDFNFSLSRRKEDKIAQTGRAHIMKNRQGLDGITYELDFNATNGHINFKGLLDAEESMEGNQNETYKQLAKSFFKLEH